MGHAGVYTREDKSKRCVWRCFLKVAIEVAEWADSKRLFQREGAQEWNALAPVLVLTLRTDRVIPLFDLSDWVGEEHGKPGVKMRRLFFHRVLYVSQLILNSTLNFTGNQWREHSSGSLQVNGGDFFATQASRFWTHWSLVRPVSAIPDKGELQ